MQCILPDARRSSDNVALLRRSKDMVTLKEKVGLNLARRRERDGYITITYIVLKTIQANPNVTLSQLEWLLSSEFMLDAEAIKPALVVMTNKNLLSFVTRWNPTGTNVIHYVIKTDKKDEVEVWLSDAVKEFPELSLLAPPILSKKR